MSIELQKLQDLDVYTRKAKPLFRWQFLVWLGFWFVAVLLIARVLLKLFLFNADGFLISSTYGVTEYLLLPMNIFFSASPTTGPSFEWVTILAIVLYWLFVVEMLALFQTSTGKSQIEISRAYSKKKYGH